ncbi:NTF2-related export protein 2-like isoform X2 [Petaurus breviceps papuanus]|uniref:NTF2-related export protein 2-like isoform X2 n=1 Tax=Petaurus breviceps papuanus TaxID=3040969 RepID=UPI0036DACA7D
MAMSVDFKTNAYQACRAAEEFVNIYYETIDKRRRVLTRLYLDTATLVWNGNAISGLNALSEFFETLPSSEFQITVVDCQPVHGNHLKTNSRILKPGKGSSSSTPSFGRWENRLEGASHSEPNNHPCGDLWNGEI